jgi:hypothetical protein
MPAPEIDLHGPHWVNIVGHLAGLVVFANLFLLLYRDASRRSQPLRLLPLLSTLLALGWDLGLLVGLGVRALNPFWANTAAAAAFACLSLLPAVLLDLSLARHIPTLRAAGYTVGAFCGLLHLSEIFIAGPGIHGFSLLLLAASFSTLTAIAWWRSRRQHPASATAICLLLFSLSFLHFRASTVDDSLWAEILLHHAAIPIALFFVLQDYRFLLADAFLRLSVNGLLALVFVAALWASQPALAAWVANPDPFARGLFFAAAAALLFAFAALRQRLQGWLTQNVFLRRDPGQLAQRLLALEGNEEDLLAQSAALLASYFRAPHWRLEPQPAPDADATLKLQFLKGDAVFLNLRGRRFLSEDLASLDQLGTLIAREVDRARNRELERLMTQAELKALQAQIHPHFLFNALNALYGSIPRAATEARRLTMSLSELFRYFLTTAKSTVRLEEELTIVEAYLRIEQARLGPRLTIQMEVPPTLLPSVIPILTLQPLVENAVKHGIAAQPGPGTLTVRAATHDGLLLLDVHDTGPGPQSTSPADSNHVGLANVRRRLALHYGPQASLSVTAGPNGTLAQLRLPAQPPSAPTRRPIQAAQVNSF